MNKVIERVGNILLDDRFTIETDGFNGVTLMFRESRKRKTKDNKEVDYIFEDSWHYPRIGQALNKYMSIQENFSKNAQEYLEVSEKNRNLVSELEKRLTQW